MKITKVKIGETFGGTYDPNATYPYNHTVNMLDSSGNVVAIYTSLKEGNKGHALTDTDWWFCKFDGSKAVKQAETAARTVKSYPIYRLSATSKFWEVSTNGGTSWESTNIDSTGEKGEDSRLRIINHGTKDTTFALIPNEIHVWGEVDSLTLTLSPFSEKDILAEYCFEFKCPANKATTLSLPSNLKWYRGIVVIPEIGKTYQCSIVNNMIVMGGA